MTVQKYSREESASDGKGVIEVRQRLRKAILRAELPPGGVFSQNELAARVSASRTPFREALRMVQGEGLIEVESGRRLRIAPLSFAEFEQVQMIRIALGAVALRLSAPQLTSPEIAGLEGAMAQMTHFLDDRDYEMFDRQYFAFHIGVVARAGETIVAEIAHLFEIAARYLRTFANDFTFSASFPQQWTELYRTLRHMLDAVKAGELDLAVAHLAYRHASAVGFVATVMDVDYSDERIESVARAVAGPIYDQLQA